MTISLGPRDVLVLIPAYNEAHNVPELAARAFGWNFDVLVVDDGSRDGTAGAARAAGAHAAVHSVNRGKGAALRTGFAWMLEREYKAVIAMDADGQHDPAELPLFLEALRKGDADLLVGTRMSRPQGMPPLRVLTNRVMSKLIASISGRRVSDSQCGYRALTRRLVEGLRLTTDRYETESEIILEAARLGLPVGEVPISCRYGKEVSRIHPIRDTFRFLSFLLRYRGRLKP